MVPGTQTRQLPHHKDPVQGNLLHEDQFDVGRQVPIELEPGGAVFFHSGVIHRSYANRSQQSRRAYTAVYGAGDLEHVEPREIRTIAENVPSYQFELIEPAAT